MDKYHCCATCINFEVIRNASGVIYKCSRLGYDTKPTYQFDCWTPNDNVKKLMNKSK